MTEYSINGIEACVDDRGGSKQCKAERISNSPAFNHRMHGMPQVQRISVFRWRGLFATHSQSSD